MTDQQLDLLEAMKRADRGIAQAEANARPPFNDVALELLHGYAQTHRLVFCDEVMAALGHRLPETHNLRALGAVYRKAASEGWIFKSPHYRPSVRSNGSMKPIWVSLIFIGGEL